MGILGNLGEPFNRDASRTPIRGLSAVGTAPSSELGANTKVRLGTIATVAITLFGGVVWLTNMSFRVDAIQSQQLAMEAGYNKQVLSLEKKIDDYKQEVVRTQDKLEHKLELQRKEAEAAKERMEKKIDELLLALKYRPP